MSSFKKQLIGLKGGRFFNYGLPFLIFVVGGSFALKQFTTVRYEVRSHQNQFGLTDEIKAQFKSERQKQVHLEELYEDMVNPKELDNWKNIRGPRPWEKDNKEYLKIIEERIEEAKKNNKKTVFSYYKDD